MYTHVGILSALFFYSTRHPLSHLSSAAYTLCGAATNISLVGEGEVVCSADNLRPASDFITRFYCNTYVLCDGNAFKVSSNAVNGKWKTVKFSAKEG